MLLAVFCPFAQATDYEDAVEAVALIQGCGKVDTGLVVYLTSCHQREKIKGYLDDKKYIDYTQKDNIDGRIGLWSKADSYVFFDNFMLEPR